MNVGGSAGEMDGSDDEMRGKRVGLFFSDVGFLFN